MSDLLRVLLITSFAAMVGVGLMRTLHRYRYSGKMREVWVLVAGLFILYGIPLWVAGYEVGYLLTLVGGGIAFLTDLREWSKLFMATILRRTRDRGGVDDRPYAR